MSYVDKNLLPGESVVHRGYVHWVIYSKSIAIIAIGVALMPPWIKELPKLWIFGAAAVVVGMLSSIPSLITVIATELVVTTRRIVAKRGLIRRQTIEMLHSKVESIEVHQSVFGRILNYGTLVIHGTGGGVETIPGISAPLKFRNAAMAQGAPVPDS